MSNNSPNALALVISAIQDMQNKIGPNPREILNYVSSLCDIPETMAKRQVLAALKRGTMQGILQETDGHYSVPLKNRDLYGIATQELGLLNLACRKRKQQQRKKKVIGHCGSGMKKKSVRRGRSKPKRSKKMKNSSCGNSGKRKRKSKSKKRSERKSRSKYDCGSKKSKKSKKNKKRKSSKGNCVCPQKNQDTKSDGCPIKNEKKEGNKCTVDFDNIITNPHRKLSKSRSDCRSRTRSRGRSRSRSSMYY